MQWQKITDWTKKLTHKIIDDNNDNCNNDTRGDNENTKETKKNDWEQKFKLEIDY